MIPKKPLPKQHLCVTIDGALKNRLYEYAKEEGCFVSSVVQVAVASYLFQFQSAKSESVPKEANGVNL